jgi:hypothetical protein
MRFSFWAWTLGERLTDQAAAEADRDRVGARTGLKLGQKVTHVALDSFLGEEKALADLAIDQSVGHELQNLDLAHRRLLLELTERRGEGDDLSGAVGPPQRCGFEAATMVHVAAQDLLALSSVHGSDIGPPDERL